MQSLNGPLNIKHSEIGFMTCYSAFTTIPKTIVIKIFQPQPNFEPGVLKYLFTHSGLDNFESKVMTSKLSFERGGII